MILTKKKQSYIGEAIAMKNRHWDIIVEGSRELMQQIEISKEDLFWFRADVGIAFLDKYFTKEEAYRMASSTNFWDLFIREWVLDDFSINQSKIIAKWDYDSISGTWVEADCLAQYKAFKMMRFDDEKLCRTLNSFLVIYER
jgi:hypothetical protein